MITDMTNGRAGRKMDSGEGNEIGLQPVATQSGRRKVESAWRLVIRCFCSADKPFEPIWAIPSRLPLWRVKFVS
jgi:hypothetical protein